MSATEIKPLRDGADVSWIPRCHPGDDQGNHGACTLFALASWAECLNNIDIDDQVCIDAWEAQRMRRYGNLDGGLTIPEAFFAAASIGLTPPGASIRRVPDLSTLPLAPLIGTYRTTQGWYNPSAAGCIDHIESEVVGHHAVLIVGHGLLNAPAPEMVWIENSWGRSWGYQGFGQMTEAYHRQYCEGVWQIVQPGIPSTMAEYNAAYAASLSEQISEPVASIMRNLQTLGYSLPADGAMIMADIVRRSMAGKLNTAQEKAKSNLADVYLMLRGEGVTDADINAVAGHLLKGSINNTAT